MENLLLMRVNVGVHDHVGMNLWVWYNAFE